VARKKKPLYGSGKQVDLTETGSKETRRWEDKGLNCAIGDPLAAKNPVSSGRKRKVEKREAVVAEAARQ